MGILPVRAFCLEYERRESSYKASSLFSEFSNGRSELWLTGNQASAPLPGTLARIFKLFTVIKWITSKRQSAPTTVANDEPYMGVLPGN